MTFAGLPSHLETQIHFRGALNRVPIDICQNRDLIYCRKKVGLKWSTSAQKGLRGVPPNTFWSRSWSVETNFFSTVRRKASILILIVGHEEDHCEKSGVIRWSYGRSAAKKGLRPKSGMYWGMPKRTCVRYSFAPISLLYHQKLPYFTRVIWVYQRIRGIKAQSLSITVFELRLFEYKKIIFKDMPNGHLAVSANSKAKFSPK